VIRLHLGLIVPSDARSCWIRVDDRICTWEEGRALVFDDTYEHEVRNDTPERRVVLFVDFDRPMDLPGTLVNRLLVFLIRASNYVRVPLKNLAEWNRKLEKAG
jgi:beta-hydroxylase